MHRPRLAHVLSAATLLCLAGNAGAQDFGIDEVRGGMAMSGLELMPKYFVIPEVTSFNIGNIDSVQFDILFRSPDVDAFRWIGSPRPSVGTVVNLRGRESVLHAGLDWHVPIGDTPVYLEAGIGLGIHNGALSGAAPPLRNVGCRTLFHWHYGAGVDLSEHVTLTAEWQHLSSVNLCQPNEGINNFGVTVGWKF